MILQTHSSEIRRNSGPSDSCQSAHLERLDMALKSLAEERR
jgi:hypothetical protein